MPCMRNVHPGMQPMHLDSPGQAWNAPGPSWCPALESTFGVEQVFPLAERSWPTQLVFLLTSQRRSKKEPPSPVLMDWHMEAYREMLKWA